MLQQNIKQCKGDFKIMGVLDNIKNDMLKSGQNSKDFVYIKEGTKKRLRFLQDMEDALEIVFHDSFALSVNVPCKESLFGKSCEYCEEEDLRTRTQYVWSVWDYDDNAVKLFMFPVNNCTPLPSLAVMYQTYGTITDRDYMFTTTGKTKDKSYTVIPMDKAKFRNAKAKPFSEKAVKDRVAKKYPYPDNDDDNVTDVSDYDDMKPKELYELCVERGLEAEKKKLASYYINLLVENDRVTDDWGDDDNTDDDWDEDEEDTSADYEGLSAKELFNMCKERNIKAQTKQKEKYYIELLVESDKAGGGDEDPDDWEDVPF